MKTKIYAIAMTFSAGIGVFAVGALFQFSILSIAIGAGAFLGYIMTHFPDDKGDTP